MLIGLLVFLLTTTRTTRTATTTATTTTTTATTHEDYPLSYSEDELRTRLTPQQYHVTQGSGTERAFTGEYWDHHEHGVYKCVVCHHELFTSTTKYESGSGWPSYYNVMNKRDVRLLRDNTHGMVRTEVRCAHCGAHLGHLFDDGPQPTGKRYCINSASLQFESRKVEL
jgi:peptide-methionine (R)-S-oxide reductase